MQENSKKKLIVLLVISLLLTVLLIGGSFAFFNIIRKGNSTAEIKAGNISLLFNDTTDCNLSLSGENALPIKDDEGKINSNYCQFTLTGTTSIEELNYSLLLEKNINSTIADKYIKIYLTEMVSGIEKAVKLNTVNDTQTFDKYIFNGTNDIFLEYNKFPIGSDNTKKTYRLRMWIDESAKSFDENGIWVLSDKSFTTKIKLSVNDIVPPNV